MALPLLIGSCSQQKGNSAAEQQAVVDSIAKVKADSIVKAKSDSIAKADSIRMEQEQQATEYESYSNKASWTGASSLEELKSKIVGTAWHCNVGGLIYQFEFSESTVIRRTTMARTGKWSNDENSVISYPYTVEVKRDSGGNNFVVVRFGDGSDLEHMDQQIAFGNKCQIVVYFMHGEVVEHLTYGEFTWDDEL